jgi:putative oxidoreductase
MSGMMCNLWCSIKCKLEHIGAPIWDLFARVYLFYVFMQSGWYKLQDFMDGSWDRVVYIFKEEFRMPFAEVMAPIVTSTELIFSVLLLIGLASRFSALVLLSIAIMLECVYPHHMSYGYF